MAESQWLLLCWGLLLSSCSLAIAKRCGLFHPFRAALLPAISGSDVLKGFACFLFVNLILMPALALLFFIWLGEGAEQLSSLGVRERGWLSAVTILGGGGGLLWVYRGLDGTQRRQLWRQSREPWYHHLAIGALCWGAAYPPVLALSQGISIALRHLFHCHLMEQTAVQRLRSALADPWLFAFTGVLVVTVVPLMEEFLFRGLLQSWLKQKGVGAFFAVVIASLVFAAFHYTYAQGIANFEWLPSLFFLSCVLGFVYERQRSLWAPVGLHGVFNLVSLLTILSTHPR